MQVAIGERRRPQPGGRPGYLRVDTVHQGDLDGIKGVYHINAVDEVTQWQVVGSVAAITQTHLEPVLRAILRQFPFPIRGFHSDNGSEFINDTVSGSAQGSADRTDQIASAPQQRQWPGGIEKRSGDSQAHGLRLTSPRYMRQDIDRVLSTHLQSLSEFSSPVRTAGTDRRFARQREAMYIVATPRHGKCCASWSALPRQPTAILNPDSPSRAWTSWQRHTVIPNRLDACKQRNESYFSVLLRSVRAHETGERGGNDGRVENEENQTQVSLRFPQPLEIAARFPHSHRAGDGSRH